MSATSIVRTGGETALALLALARARVLLRMRPTGGLLAGRPVGGGGRATLASDRGDGALAPQDPDRPAEGVPRASGGGGGGAELERAREIARTVERASRFRFARAPCLVRAMALRWLLDRRGLPGGRVRVGVRRGAEGFAAHAWVEFHGHPIGEDTENVKTFSRLAELDVRDAR